MAELELIDCCDQRVSTCTESFGQVQCTGMSHDPVEPCSRAKLWMNSNRRCVLPLPSPPGDPSETAETAAGGRTTSWAGHRGEATVEPADGNRIR